MLPEYEQNANDVRQTLIGLGERSPAVVALADMCGLQVWQLVHHWCDHLPPDSFATIVDQWSVDVMHNAVAALIVWAQEQQSVGDAFDDTAPENSDLYE